MAQSSQSVTAHSFDDDIGARSAGTVGDATSLAVNVDEAVRLALVRQEDAAATDSMPRGMAAGRVTMRAGPLRYGAGSLLVNAPPSANPSPRRATLHALQEWEGYVLEILEEEFVVRLVDLTSGSSHEEEEATIPLAEISDDDAARLRVGAIFRWVIGYERAPSGTKKRVSQIVFRDLPRLTERDLQRGREWARETRKALKL